MSLNINVDNVVAVLIKDTGWEGVAPLEDKPEVSSFFLDAYEFVDGDELLMGGGVEEAAGIPATGFGFTDTDGCKIRGPITSILAVRCR